MSCRALAVTGLVVLLAGGPARAQSTNGLNDVYFDVGYVQAIDAVTFGDQGLSGMGFRYYERHCCLARGVATLTVGLIATAAAVITGAQSIKSQTVTEESDAFGTTRTTTTEYYSEEEKAARRERASQGSADAIGAMSGWRLDMEVIYFPQQDDGNLHGLQWTVYLAEFFESRPFRFETGFHIDALGGRLEDPQSGMEREVKYRNIGIPFRFVYRPVDWLQGDAELRWNLMSGNDDRDFGENTNQGLRGSLTMQLPARRLDLFYARLTAQSNHGFDVGRAGYLLELGLRL